MNKILLFCQDAVGGAERITAFIGRELFSQSKEVIFCLIRKKGKSSITDFLPKDINIKYISGDNGVICLMSMIKTILRVRPDYVFASVLNLNTKLLLIRKIFPKIKFIVRCDNYIYTYTPKQRKLLAMTYQNADRIIAQTEEMRDELIDQIGIKRNKVIVLHNPIDKKTINKKIQNVNSPYPEDGKKHIVAVGRFNHQKGFDFLIDAFIRVYEKNSKVELYIVGDSSIGNGEVAKDVRSKAEKAGISSSVHICGYQANPYPYIKNADCFVLSSRWEGLPNVLIESLYLGTPVAAFKCIPIIERIIEEGKTGYCAEKEDVSSLTQAIINTMQLGRVTSTYNSASIEDFVELFN